MSLERFGSDWFDNVFGEYDGSVTGFIISDDPIGIADFTAEGGMFTSDEPGTNFIFAPFLSVFRSICACAANVVHSVKSIRKYLFMLMILLFSCKYIESI